KVGINPNVPLKTGFEGRIRITNTFVIIRRRTRHPGRVAEGNAGGRSIFIQKQKPGVNLPVTHQAYIRRGITHITDTSADFQKIKADGPVYPGHKLFLAEGISQTYRGEKPITVAFVKVF